MSPVQCEIGFHRFAPPIFVLFVFKKTFMFETTFVLFVQFVFK